MLHLVQTFQVSPQASWIEMTLFLIIIMQFLSEHLSTLEFLAHVTPKW